MHKQENYSEKELVQDPSFRRWALGNASKEEMQFWDGWVQQSNYNRQKAIRAQASITGYTITSEVTPDTKEEWIKIEEKLRGSTLNRNTSVNKTTSFPRFNLLMRVAAVLIIGLGIGWGIFSISQEAEQQIVETATASVTTDFGERKSLFLSDGTKIILNANSSISYKPEYEKGEDFIVSLKGEAFFEVTKRKTSNDPKFTVKTRDGRITVLGTRFVVNTRRSTQVVLEEGLVSMDPLDDVAENKDKTTYLRPGELAHFSADTDTVHIKKINPEVYTSWTTPKLVFDETPLAEIGERIEETFGVEVVFADSKLKERKVSGSIENGSLQVIVRGLSKTLMTSSEIREEKVIFGTIQQE